MVGLGNPGPGYERTRHNVGFQVVELLAARLGERFTTDRRSGADLIQARLADRRVILAKPRGYMNTSGRPVGLLARYFSVPVGDIVVVHDDLDLDVGVIRLKRGGGEGGHNGLRSISAALSSRDYPRVRIGIGRPPGRKDPAAFVLEPFTVAERKELPVTLEDAADAVELLLRTDLESAQNQVHRRT